jgi:hypothetical protein
VLAVATVLTWYAWLGHETGYRVDPVTGNYSGPYSTGQVAGCVLTLLVLLVAAVLLRVHWLAAAASMTVAFTGAWTADAASKDVTGLFGVGAILVFAGMAAGTVLIGMLTAVVGRRRPAR